MSRLINLFKTLKEDSPLLYWVVVIHGFVAIACLLGLVFDERTLMGVNVWIKPLKFCISDAIYMATVGYLIGLYPYSQRKKSIINNIVAITLMMELIILVFQAFRGVQSHYNMSSPMDGLLFALMGILIGVNVLIMTLFIVDTARLKLSIDKSIQWAILIGWLIVFFGSWIGGQMISQMSHNVGVADGGKGLPLVNWSTIAGDLRVAHFFGLHGIQIIPLFAFMLTKRWETAERNRIIAVTLVGLAYAALIGFTFYQAKQGLPLIAM